MTLLSAQLPFLPLNIHFKLDESHRLELLIADEVRIRKAPVPFEQHSESTLPIANSCPIFIVGRTEILLRVLSLVFVIESGFEPQVLVLG
jgi:hypothetical protein